MAERRFQVVLVKPSHYDDDGYVIQWRRSTIPSNSLASVYGLLAECAEGRVLGPDVDIEFEIYDECNTIIDFPAVSKRILADSGMVALVGVQSNQFPRALDIGRGCPFQCSFCTIINVQGRKSRYRTPDDVEAIVRANAAQGVTRFFVTDDNFARNRNWEPILDRLIELRENQGFRIRLLLQV